MTVEFNCREVIRVEDIPFGYTLLHLDSTGMPGLSWIIQDVKIFPEDIVLDPLLVAHAWNEMDSGTEHFALLVPVMTGVREVRNGIALLNCAPAPRALTPRDIFMQVSSAITHMNIDPDFLQKYKLV